MAKMFSISLNGAAEEFTARQYIDARSKAQQITGAYGYEGCAAEGWTFALHGETVTPEEFLAACEACYGAWLEKKLSTHVYRRVRYGSSSSYVWQWVKK